MSSRVSLVEVNTLQSVLSRLYMIIINYGEEQDQPTRAGVVLPLIPQTTACRNYVINYFKLKPERNKSWWKLLTVGEITVTVRR